MKSIVALRAARGADLMDKVHPGWFQEIRLDDLDMASGVQCILGQVFGDFAVGARKLDLMGTDGGTRTIRYGFVSIFCYWRLRRAWCSEVERRRVDDFLMRARLENAEQEVAMTGA